MVFNLDIIVLIFNLKFYQYFLKPKNLNLLVKAIHSNHKYLNFILKLFKILNIMVPDGDERYIFKDIKIINFHMNSYVLVYAEHEYYV